MEENLSELKEQYLESLKIRNYAESTIKGADWRLGKFFVYLEGLGINHSDGITKVIIHDYQTELYHTINSLGRPNSVCFQNGMLSAVKCFMYFLKERDYIVSDPSQDIQYAKLPKRLPRGILSSSVDRNIIHAPDTTCVLGYRDKTIMEVLYTTGIRKSELIMLTLDDVDYQDGFLRVNGGKGRKDRVVPLGRIACRYLENYVKSIRPEMIKNPFNNHLFLSARGNRLSKNAVWEVVKKYTRQAGIKKNVYPHTFRHTCATAMLKNKADIRAVQELLGHESLETTQIYTRITINDLKETHRRCHPRERDKLQ